jgi:hypothetical protein
MVGAHAIDKVFPKASDYILSIWTAVCMYCELRCATRKQGAPYALSGVDMLIDPSWTLPLQRIHGLPHRIVFYSWDPGKMGRLFHFYGGLLETVGTTEMLVNQVARDSSGRNIRINQEMRSSGGFLFSWRAALAHFGVAKAAINHIIDTHVRQLEANWTRDITAHSEGRI